MIAAWIGAGIGVGGWGGALGRAVTLACAACAARPEEGHRTVLFIAAMVLLPFVVGGAAVVAIRRLDRRETGAPGEPPGAPRR